MKLKVEKYHRLLGFQVHENVALKKKNLKRLIWLFAFDEIKISVALKGAFSELQIWQFFISLQLLSI